MQGFLSTLSLRRATAHYDNYNLHCVISIHALLAESDASNHRERQAQHISIHALLAESDMLVPSLVMRMVLFLSTLSLRRATNMEVRMICTSMNFYPRSPCGERPNNQPERQAQHDFYPRSPCGERPGCQQPCGHPTTNFYPRSPCGERPPYNLMIHHAKKISIHALLAESDKRL